MRWHAYRGNDPAADASAGVEALEMFFHACDTGKTGSYTLRNGSLVMATAKVKRGEMDIVWRRGRIFYTLGEVGLLAEVAKVEAFLAKEGDMPR